MRKLKRSVMRHEAELTGAKTSEVLRKMWHRHQEQKYGFNLALLFRNIGTGRSKKMRKAMSRYHRTKGVVAR